MGGSERKPELVEIDRIRRCVAGWLAPVGDAQGGHTARRHRTWSLHSSTLLQATGLCTTMSYVPDPCLA